MLVNGSHSNLLDLHRFATAIALTAAYDYEPKPRDDPMVSIVDEYLKASVPGLAPSKMFLLKAFPFCKCPWLIRKAIPFRLFGKYCTCLTGFPGHGLNVGQERRMRGGPN